MLAQLISRGTSLYPRLYLQMAALAGLLIAAEFSMGTLSMMLTQRAVYRVSQRVRRRQAARQANATCPGGNCCA